MACNCGNQGSSEINTLACSTQPACTSNIASTCSCGCSPCQCGVSQVPTPVPFFNATTSAIQECHNSVTIQQTFITSIATGKAFNMPACGASVTISIPGLQKIQVGSYIWNVTYGYLHVTSFNYLTSQITVKNECNLSNAAAGTLIPACTMFNVVDPPFETDSGCGGPGVFVLVDFVVPAVSGSTNLVVSSLVGLAVGMVVQIQSGRYTITDIVDATTITITNDTGAGGVPGTTVSAKDINGNCIAPVTPLLESPCDETAVSQGSIVVCKNGIPTTLDAAALGQVPVVVDATTNEVEFQTLDLPIEICSYLTECATIIGVGVGTTASIIVADSTVFSIGTVITIKYSGLENIRWVITNIVPTASPPEGTLSITSLDAVGANYSLPELTEVCADDCCTQIEYDLSVGSKICSYDWSDAFKSDQQSSLGANNTFTLAPPIDPIGGPPTSNLGAAESIIIENPTCNPMHIMVSYHFMIRGYFAAQEGDFAEVKLDPYVGNDTVAIGVAFPAPTYVLAFPLTDSLHFGIGRLPGSEPCDPFVYYYNKTYNFTETHTLAAGFKINCYLRQYFYYLGFFASIAANSCCPCHTTAGATGNFECEQSHVRIHGLGVAVQAA